MPSCNVTVSLFADEVGPKLDQQMDLCELVGAPGFDLRFLQIGDEEKRSFAMLNDDEARDVSNRIADRGLQVLGFGTRIGKFGAELHDNGWTDDEFRSVMDEVKRVADLGQLFGRPPARIFGGKRAEELPFDQIVTRMLEHMGQIADEFQKAGMPVKIENEPWTGFGTLEELANGLAQLKHLNVTGAVDQANALCAGATSSRLVSAFELVAPFTGDIHAKYLRPDDPKLVAGRWAKEADLTFFDAIPYKDDFYDVALQALAAAGAKSADVNAAICLSHGTPIRVVAEPHMGRSFKDHGETKPAEFARSMLGIRRWLGRIAATHNLKPLD